MARSVRGLVALTVTVLAACDAPTVPAENFAYDPTSLTSGLVYHWDRGYNIRIYVDSTAGGDSLSKHVSAGAQAWVDAVYYRELRYNIVSTPADADVIIHTDAAPYLVGFADCESPQPFGAGTTYFCANEDFTRFTVFPLLSGGGGSVKMDVSIDVTAVSTPTALRALVTHELGHVFGIGGHSGDPDDVMFAGAAVTTPSPRDEATMRYVLHQRPDIRP